jgi:hypothetical protein
VAKLNQVIAIEKGIKSQVYGKLTELNKAIQRQEIFSGISKTYLKKDEDAEDLPSEHKKAQANSRYVFNTARYLMSEVMQVTARKDWSNKHASADVVVNGVTLVEAAPVTYLLFLEKQCNDLGTLVNNIPVLDEAEDWKKDENSDMYRTAPALTHRTKKVQKPIVLYDATEAHPAQTQIITEDVVAGHWETVKRSGALPRPEKERILERIMKLSMAIKEAREAANSIEETVPPEVGQAVFDYVFEQ